jgi:signal transduction histidine kinase
LPKRSILIGVTVAYIVSLVCGFVVAHVLAKKSYNMYVAPTFEAMDRLELNQARSALGRGGNAALKEYMESLDRAFGGRHYLLKSDGTDLVTGQPKVFLLPPQAGTRYRGYDGGAFHLAQLSDDGQVWFAVFGSSAVTGPATWAYFAVCVVVTTGLLLFSLLYLVFPLRAIRDALGQFGTGQMDKRINISRGDEIGQVAASFNTMAERVEQSFRTERSLLQDISHELRAPLARLNLAVHLAKQERPDASTEQIERNVKKLTALVGEITEFHQKWSTVENSQPLEAVNLDEVLQEVCEDVQLEAASRSIAIELTAIPIELPNARPELIGRVFGNILRNAVIYAPVGSRILVDLQRKGEEAVVTVRDFGGGVAEENLERIFDPFYREVDEQDQRAGLGLGLSIARRGVQWHGGTLKAENADPGLRLTAIFPINPSFPG